MRRVCLLAVIPALLLGLVQPVGGFVTLNWFFVFNDQGFDVAATLQESTRWSAADHESIGGAGIRDGLQVAVEPDFAEKLALAVTGGADPEDLADIEASVVDAFAAWESAVFSTTVTFDAAAMRGTALGAEVDLFAVPDSDPVFLDNPYYGVTFVDSQWLDDRLLTNGVVLPGYAITGTDIFVNIDQLEAVAAFLPRELQLAVFRRLLMHEIGHALGLDHPNVFRGQNLDTDDDPMTAVRVDPDDPFTGLVVSRNVDADAIMSNRPSLNGVLVTALRADDRSGRDVLYPAPLPCVGDCNGDGVVTIEELVSAVNLALGGPGDCDAADRDGNGAVTVDELIAAVNNALLGCAESVRSPLSDQAGRSQSGCPVQQYVQSFSRGSPIAATMSSRVW